MRVLRIPCILRILYFRRKSRVRLVYSIAFCLRILRILCVLRILRGVDPGEEFALPFRLIPSTDKSGGLRVLEKIFRQPTDEGRFPDAAER